MKASTVAAVRRSFPDLTRTQWKNLWHSFRVGRRRLTERESLAWIAHAHGNGDRLLLLAVVG